METWHIPARGQYTRIAQPDPDAPSEDAWEAFDRSLERLVLTGASTNEAIHATFEAGYDAGRLAERYPPGVQIGAPGEPLYTPWTDA